ncbi:VpsP family polysaccharide biosynthesis protein [Microbulbifer mangrovi]|uniref:VpsP family polysaccharide biosynthesis protein n=1 Tax=Microbulbifer mangrovi TaxID=927787 RepID=UPI00117D361D|nr:VpsP family polysaccharide biosynthesis protein [Microbulbifer mangrovi]
MHSSSITHSSSGRRRRRRSSRQSAFAHVKRLLWPAEASLATRLGVWGLVFVLAFLGVHGTKQGLANLQVIHVENQLKYWYKLGKVASPASMESALFSIERARELHPDNPYQLTLHARLLEWRGFSGGTSAAEDYRAALSLYQQAAALRPLWPDSWAEMAQLKLRLFEFDEDLDRYLARAAALGPYTPAVHNAIVQAGLPRLPVLKALEDERMEMLKTHMVRGIKDHRSRNTVLTQVSMYRQEREICDWLTESQLFERLPGICKAG